MCYKVFTVEYYGSDRDHKAVFVSDAKDVPGKVYHVKGGLLMGMKYEAKTTSPLKSHYYVPESIVQIGTVKKVDMSRFETVCESMTPPWPQEDRRGQPLDSSKPLYRCREWVDDVVAQLVQNGIMAEL